MKRTEVKLQLDHFPASLYPFLKGARLFDSSCSPQAQVWLIDREDGFFLKSAAAGSLKKEAQMTEFFHQKGLGAEVLGYIQEDWDWLLTRRIPGEDCIYPPYREDERWLCDTLAELLRRLHDTDPTGCPVNRTAEYVASAQENYRLGNYDQTQFPDNWGYACAEDAWRVVCEAAPILQNNILLHGDYCLPNIILNNKTFSGFIDLGNGGLGDRHIDIFWGIWSLGFNLKTDRWKDRFLDVYGRDKVEPDLLNSIGAFEVFL
jgi:kanamycin kinase